MNTNHLVLFLVTVIAVSAVLFLTCTTKGKALTGSIFGRAEPFIDLPAFGSTVSEVRSRFGEETESEPDDTKALGTCLTFRKNGCEISATFVDDALERIFVIPRTEDGFTDAELATMKEFYGQGRKWNKVVDSGYMEMFRREDDAAYFIFTGIAQFKTQKYEILPDQPR